MSAFSDDQLHRFRLVRQCLFCFSLSEEAILPFCKFVRDGMTGLRRLLCWLGRKCKDNDHPEDYHQACNSFFPSIHFYSLFFLFCFRLFHLDFCQKFVPILSFCICYVKFSCQFFCPCKKYIYDSVSVMSNLAVNSFAHVRNVFIFSLFDFKKDM